MTKGFQKGNKMMNGRKLTDKWKRNIGLARLGRKHSKESIEKMRVNKDERNGQWKGDNVSKEGLHQYMHKRISKPDICPCCEEKPPRDLANYTDIYTRDEINWCWLCRSCHLKLDYATGIKKPPRHKHGPHKRFK